MLQFISDNLATILVGFAVAALLALSLWAMRRDKKKHALEGGCGGGTSGDGVRAGCAAQRCGPLLFHHEAPARNAGGLRRHPRLQRGRHACGLRAPWPVTA